MSDPFLDAELVARIDCRAALGEGVIWDDKAGAVFWVDIEGARLFRAQPPFDRFDVFEAPERIGSIGPVEGRDDQLVAAFESGFAVYHFDSGRVDWLAVPDLADDVRFNDGRVDRQGRFWAGTMVETPGRRASGDGVLYRLDGPDRVTPMLDGVGICNSLCWSPDGDRMYFADTPQREIRAYRMENGRPVDSTVFATLSRGAPDGSSIDAEGALWNAQWGAGQVARYRPDGTLAGVISLPCPNVSCVAFGGADLDLLFVTTARVELDAEALASAPASGSLFVYRTGFKGLAESRWRPFA